MFESYSFSFMETFYFWVSFGLTCLFILGTLKLSSSLPNQDSVSSQSVEVVPEEFYHFRCISTQSHSNGVAPKEFENSEVFGKLTIDQRADVMRDYLWKESRSVYNCILHKENRKCFKYDSRGGVYADKKYRIEDMVMKYPHTYHTIINNENACQDDTYIVVGSPVGPRQFMERMGTREAWGNIREVEGKKVIHLFFAGHDEDDPEGDRLLREESEKFHDIVQFDMKNHFMNLTLLAILTYNWTSHYCPKIAYYVRADNDVWYNPRTHIKQFLMQRRSQTLIGTIVTGNKPIHVDVSRYWMPKTLFPQNVFDPYPSGCFVTIAGDTLATIVKYSEHIGPILYFDDTFLGQVAAITNITLLTYPQGVMEFMWKAYMPGVYMRLSAAHRYTPVDVVALWQLANR